MPKVCNGCKHLSIDEDEQNLIKSQSGEIYPHICKKYNKRVLHMPYKEPYIHPCEECNRDRFYKRLQKRYG